jgi:hypothetical protein
MIDLIPLYSAAVDYSAKEYDDLWKTLTALDAKAQGTTAIAGVMTAASLTITGRESFATANRLFGIWLLLPGALALLLLILAIIFSVVGMKVRALPEAFRSRQVAATLRDLTAIDESERNADALLRYYQGLLSGWKDTLDEIESVLSKKAMWVEAAQALLLAGTIVLCLLVGGVFLCQG